MKISKRYLAQLSWLVSAAAQAPAPAEGARTCCPEGAHLVHSDDIVLAAVHEDILRPPEAKSRTGVLQPLLPATDRGDRLPGQRTESGSAPSLLRSLASINFWLLFVIFGSSTGCGLMLLLNLGEPPGSSALQHFAGRSVQCIALFVVW